MLEDYIQLLNLNKDRLMPGQIDGAMWTVKDVEYNDVALQFDRFNIDFDRKHQEMTIDFPLLKSFVMHGSYDFEQVLGMFKVGGPGTFKVGNMELKATFSEKVGKSGYPTFYCPLFKFYIGHSSFDLHDHKIFSRVSTELLHIFNVLASQATKWFGMGVVDKAVANLGKDLTNNYNLPFRMFFEDQAIPFNIDLR